MRGLDLRSDFTGRGGAALVVGASGALGAAIAAELAARGSAVSLTFCRNAESAEAAASQVQLCGQRSWISQLDLASDDAAAEVVGEMSAAAGGLHTLVYAAGPHVPQRHLSRVDPELMRSQLVADASGFFAVAHASLPHLRASRGSIVALSSAGVSRFPVRDGLSTIPKAAVEAAVRALAAEEGRFGVRVNSIGVGMLTDGMAARLTVSGELDDEALEAARSNIPLRAFGRARDVAEAVCFLASQRARYISGQHLAVDGGYSA